MPSRPYKDLIIYGCFVLNRLVAGMGIDLYQDGLEAKLGLVLPNQHGLSKEEVKRGPFPQFRVVSVKPLGQPCQ